MPLKQVFASVFTITDMSVELLHECFVLLTEIISVWNICVQFSGPMWEPVGSEEIAVQGDEDCGQGY